MVLILFGGLAISFGFVLLYDPATFADWYLRAMPSFFRERTSEEEARSAVRIGGVLMALFGVLLIVLNFFLKP